MKVFFSILATLLFATTVFASGKLSVQGNWYEEGKAVRPTIGFSVYEKLIGKTYLNAWTGYGTQFLETHDDVNWYIAKAQVDMRFGNLTASPGLTYKKLVDDHFDDVIPYFKVDYQLW